LTEIHGDRSGAVAAAHAEQIASARAADILERKGQEIATRWLERLRTGLYPQRTDLLADLFDNGLQLIRGVAEALRHEPGAPPAVIVGAYARQRIAQGVHLADLLREYQFLRQEMWRELQEDVIDLPASTIFDLSVAFDMALGTMATIAARTYGAELERQVAQLDATLASIPDAFIITGPDGHIVRMNEAARRLWGYTPGMVGAPWPESLVVQTPEGRTIRSPEMPLARAQRGETTQGMILRLDQPGGGTTWISASAAPIRGADGRLLGAVGTYTDITALRELQALRNAQTQREDLLVGISHHLRTRLTVVQGQAQLLLRTLDEAGITDRRERISAEAIVANARRMNTMIQDLIDAVRLEASQVQLRRQPVDLRSFVLSLKAQQADTIESERIRVDAPPDLPPVSADPERLQRILLSLLSNALKYSAPDTEVIVHLRQHDGEIITSVEDHGRGIAPEELPRLFQRYYPEAPGQRREGLGLSLYVTRMFVEAHGGRIWVESQVGKGSTFSFSLPLA